MSFRGILTILFRIFFLLFLITLPFNFQAFLAGALFAKYNNDGIGKGIELYVREVDQFSWMDQWSVPGAPSIWDVEDNDSPFLVPRLRLNTWADKLGLTIPYAHQEGFELDAPINEVFAFDGAVRDVSVHRYLPTEYWIYVSSMTMPEVYQWDQAFVELLEYHEMHALPENTTIAYIDCGAAPFLCHIWQVRYPGLMHFKIDIDRSVSDDIDPAAFQSPLDQLRPLEVRIFDLGLQYDESPLPPGVFPSRFEQMKALTSNDGAYTIEEEYNEVRRAYDCFNELYYFPACNRQGSFLDYTSEFDNFLLKRIAKPIGLEDALGMMNAVAFLTSTAFSTAFYVIANLVSKFWASFFGKPTEMDHLAERLEERQAVAEGGGLLGGAVNGFMDWMENHVESSGSESAEQPAVTTQKDGMKEALASLRVNMSAILKGA